MVNSPSRLSSTSGFWGWGQFHGSHVRTQAPSSPQTPHTQDSSSRSQRPGTSHHLTRHGGRHPHYIRQSHRDHFFLHPGHPPCTHRPGSPLAHPSQPEGGLAKEVCVGMEQSLSWVLSSVCLSVCFCPCVSGGGRGFVSTLTWEVESRVKAALEGVTPPARCPPNRLFVPEGLRSSVIQWGHCSNVACHPGVSRTRSLVKQRFWWPLMARDVHDFVLACSVCATGKSSNRPPDGLLQPLPVPSRPWSHIALDFVTALPPSQGHTVVLTVVDRFSKAAHFIPLPKLPSAKETALVVVDHVFRLHGLPIDVVSDRGPQFVSRFWREFCKLLGATVSLSSGFHPQSNGQTERANQDLERTLRCVVSKNPSSWSQQLSMVEYAHNTLPVSSTGLSPFECSVGYQPPIFPSLESEVAVPSAHAFVQRCHRTWTRARETLLQVGSRTKAKADRHRSRPPVYVVGQKVWLSTKNIPLRSVSNKLAPKFIGPFAVTEIISPVAVRLNLPPAYRRIHPAFHVSKIKPVFRSRINPPAPVPPPPRLVDGETTYSVNRILDSRRRGRGFQYLVDWEGYGPEERSWVPARDILDHSLIDDYNRQVRGPGNARRRS